MATRTRSARSFAWVSLTFVKGVLIISALGLARSFVMARLAHP
ncbi:hypothetical protein [Deinococcus navajonensis]|uniref:Uncharacterized protein n=1 Tax=Deinococcus navajonensis TaxID=309884 RepID=A0ABV8XSD2_9DEIO